MRIKNQYHLQPTEFESHAVTLEDNYGNIIFAAIEMDDGGIIAAQAGEKDFPLLMKLMNIDKVTAVTNVAPKSIHEMRKLLD